MNRSIVVRASLISLVAFGCGGRSQLPGRMHDGGVSDAPAANDPDVLIPVPDAPDCSSDEECPGYGDMCHRVMCDLPKGVCVQLPPVNCDDQDPCTEDACDSATGDCHHVSKAFDNDHDGHMGPLPGYAPGEPGSCGDDCDDTSDKAFPGNPEICDGVDNDCNGVVDDEAKYVPISPNPVQVTTKGDAPAGPGVLGWTASSGYLAPMTVSRNGKTSVVTQKLDNQGNKVGGPVSLTLVNADAQGGSMVWTGDRYGIVWSDRRDSDYEVFFNTMDSDGNKLGPDMRITNDPGFSINATTKFDGSRFILAWQDQREGTFSIYGQLMAPDGSPIGTNVKLISGSVDSAESPALAVGQHNIGLAWGSGGNVKHDVRFQAFHPDLTSASGQVLLTSSSLHGVYPNVVWNHDAYVVFWYDMDGPPYDIYAARVDESGAVVQGATAIASGVQHQRYPSLLPLGDRLLLVFSDDRDNNQGYELYARMLSNDLKPMAPDVRVTNAPGQSLAPSMHFGNDGDVGVLFRDDRLGAPQVFFTRLTCVTEAP